MRGRLRKIYLFARRALSEALIERRRGIETSRYVSLETLGLAAPERVRYEPSSWLDLRRILRPGEVTDDDVFIDLGSGKGRVLLQAARYPFKRVLGLEISEQLNAVARDNLRRYRGRRRCEAIELVTADLCDYELPEDVTVAYCYNAFRGELFQELVDKLLTSVDRNPRPLRLIYRTPLEEQRLLDTGRASLIRVAPGLRPSCGWSRKMSIRMYAIEPAGAASRPRAGRA